MSPPRKVALVTGSATGIGRAVAIRFAKEGMAVAVNYSRSEKEAQETLWRRCSELRACRRLLTCKADRGNEAEATAMVERCVRELGGLDVLVNNAGTTRFIEHTNLNAVTSEVWDEILGVNLKGTFFCSRAAVPHMQAAGGAIVNVTSVAGLQGHGSSIPYAASKAAVNCMTKSLARAFGPKVRVNAVAPGPVLTRWLANHMDQVARSLSITPMGRAAIPEDIADAVWFLALGTSLMTGQVMIVDGGRTM